jgi:hypothetical protein
MLFQVESGEYTTRIDRLTAMQAAMDALALLRFKNRKYQLSPLTTTICTKGVVVYFSTLGLMNHGSEFLVLK